MRDKLLEERVEMRKEGSVTFDRLMLQRVRNVLLVSSLYDSFILQEDGRLTDALISDYLELNLQYVPTMERVSTAGEALEALQSKSFDLVIFMIRVGDVDVFEFGRAVKKIDPNLPLILLANDTREISILQGYGNIPGIDRIFAWQGDVRLFMAIIKYVEDRMNAWHDSQSTGVNVLILVEDNIRFYSSYLPMLYTELVKQTQSLMADGINRMDKLMRMRARPKILLATTYEEGMELYERYQKYVLGAILDASFPKNGKVYLSAGIDFAKIIKQKTPDRPVLIQSSNQENEPLARELGIEFINKQSPTLLGEVCKFMGEHLGFGDFVFCNLGGEAVARASDLRSLVESISQVPANSILYHGGRNDFSSWLMARTEFELARRLRPVKVEEFADAEDLRRYLLDALSSYRDRARAGVIAEFSSGTFDASSGFVRIGEGSLGGKGRGLAFMNSLIKRYKVDEKLPGVKIAVPPTAVLATGVFDEFMRQPGLMELALSDASDQEIIDAFLDARLSENALEPLKIFLNRIGYPLAVRSSSLLEDATFQPFAGIYLTCMIPNNHSDLGVRLNQLERAIKLVYASTYLSGAKSYIKMAPNRLEEERMAVLIQQVVGRRRGDFIYPDMAGVARSYDYYPMEGMKSEEGIVSVVLGLGKTVVDGGRSIRFSPANPQRLYQFSSPAETLKSAQRDFLALNLSNPSFHLETKNAETTLVSLGLDVAEKQGALWATGSVCSPENDAVYDGISRSGVRLVTMSGVLKSGAYPLAEVVSFLLDFCGTAFNYPVEMEFAANIKESESALHEFAILQVRPAVVDLGTADIDLDKVEKDASICVSRKALGNGRIDGIRDIVYVPAERFERSRTVQIADEIGLFNGRLQTENRPFLLAGPGRWGSADRWLGIPVAWRQISGARCIIETDMEDIKVVPSQGTHFFQNITSFGIGYFTVNFEGLGGSLETKWLDAQKAEGETEHVRHISFQEPIEIAVDGRRGIGVVMKPGRNVPRRSE